MSARFMTIIMAHEKSTKFVDDKENVDTEDVDTEDVDREGEEESNNTKIPDCLFNFMK